MSKQKEPMIDYPNNPYKIPVKEPFMVRLKRFLYNPETGALLGRTPSSWGEWFA